MDRREPQRLTFAEYMHQGASFRMFRHELTVPIALHWHEFYELAYVYEGRGWQIWNGTRYPLGPGSLFLLTPADFHEIVPEPGGRLRLYNTIFSEDMLSSELMQLVFRGGEEHAAEVLGPDMSLLVAEFERVWDECHGQQGGHQLWVKGALERILIVLSRHRLTSVERDIAGDGLKPAIRRALTYIHYHFREAVTLEDAAKQAGMSPNYFSGTFRQQAGMSFQSYLQWLRLRFAKALLQASDLPITDVCYAAGFHTLSHFERVFKIKFGCTPSALRKENGEKA